MGKAATPIVCGLIAGFFLGCGGSDGSSASDSDAAAITRAYDAYFAAIRAGNGRAACEQLTPALRSQAADFVPPTQRSKFRGASCPQVITKGTLPQLARFTPQLKRIQVNGNRASGFNPGQGPFGPQKVLFERLGGEWKISRTIFFR